MGKPIPIKVCGYNAEIDSIFSHIYTLSVSIRFKPLVHNLDSFILDIPSDDYKDKDKFIKIVTKKAEMRFQQYLNRKHVEELENIQKNRTEQLAVLLRNRFGL